VPIITMAGRPLAKSLVKGGVILYEMGREKVAGAGEALEDLIAEARAELEQQPRTVTASSEEEADRVMREREAGARDSERSTEAMSSRRAGVAARETGYGA
jgi:hypothetical protein